MEKELIAQWLAGGRDYALGAELYRRYGTSEFLKELFGSPEDSFNKRKLVTALQDLHDTLISLPNMQTVQVIRRQIVQDVIEDSLKRPSERYDAPALVASTVSERKRMWKETTNLHAQLPYLPTEAMRLEVALKILDKVDEMTTMWELTDYYDLHQKLPDRVKVRQSDIPQLDDVTLNKEWLTCYKYVRKFWKDQKCAEKVSQRRERMAAIEAELTSRDAFQHENLSTPADGGSAQPAQS